MENADEVILKVSATASDSKSTMYVSCSKAGGMAAIKIREHARREMSKIECML
jgi:preprotein translocase subunit SecB